LLALGERRCVLGRTAPKWPDFDAEFKKKHPRKCLRPLCLGNRKRRGNLPRPYLSATMKLLAFPLPVSRRQSGSLGLLGSSHRDSGAELWLKSVPKLLHRLTLQVRARDEIQAPMGMVHFDVYFDTISQFTRPIYSVCWS